MTRLPFDQQDLIPIFLAVVAWLAAGGLIGAPYFLTLRWNVHMFATGRSLRLALAVQLARFAAMAGVLALVALHFGAFPLLAATAGVLVARMVFVRWGVHS